MLFKIASLYRIIKAVTSAWLLTGKHYDTYIYVDKMTLQYIYDYSNEMIVITMPLYKRKY